MTTAEQIFEQAKALSPTLQQEALDFMRFLADRHQPVDPNTPEFASELVAAFTEAKEQALRSARNGS